MSQQDKAKQLVEKYFWKACKTMQQAKQCALMEVQTYLNPIDNNWWAYYELKPLVIGKGRTKEEAVENLKHITIYGE